MTNTIPNRAKGFSLIELLVALAIGLLVTLVVTQAYLSGLGAQRAQTDVGRAQESSRFAFDLLARSLRKAGYKNPKAPGTGFCDSSNVPRIIVSNDASAISASTFGTSATIVNSSDVIQVRYFGEGLATTPFTTDGTMRDCLGNTIASNTLVSDTFFIAADTNNNNEPALFCYYQQRPTVIRWKPGALVPGVESMQLLYGEDTDGDGAINRYVPGSAITNANANNVRNTMLSLVTRTANANAVDRSAQAINHFGTSYAPSSGDANIFTTPADGRTRQHFSTTIALRNLCPV